MKKSLIAMTSITYAMKAKNLLNSLKYYCEIQPNPKASHLCDVFLLLLTPDAMINISALK